jgi:hypothetical protein
MTDFDTRTTQLTIAPKGDAIYSEMATTIEIVDDAGGEYVIVDQSGRDGGGKVAINPEEWPAIRAAINRMVKQCKDER